MPAPAALARVSAEAVFVDSLDLAGRPHVVVDGPPLPGTALCLSHWPSADTPDELVADTSAGIVERYIETKPGGVLLDAVTTNHYDEDGVLAIWLLLERPASSDARRGRAVAAAEAGDFHTWTDPDAARIAITLMAMAERATTPFPEVMRALSDSSGRDPAGAITAAVLARTGRVLDDPARYARLWDPRWGRIEADRELLASGEATIEEHLDVDLAVVRTPRPLDPFASYPQISAMRVLQITPGGEAELVQRYETWVRYASRRLSPRVDLAGLAAALDGIEEGPARWGFDGIAAMTPRLSPRAPSGGTAPTAIAAERLVDAVLEALGSEGRSQVPA